VGGTPPPLLTSVLCASNSFKQEGYEDKALLRQSQQSVYVHRVCQMVLFHMCDMPHSYMTRLFHMCDMTPSYV